MRYVSYLLVFYVIGRLLGFARYSWTRGEWPAAAGTLLLAVLTLVMPLLAIIVLK